MVLKGLLKSLESLRKSLILKLDTRPKELRPQRGSVFNVPGEDIVLESAFVTVLDVAIFHEFGTVNMPERSFVRAAFDENRSSYEALNKKLLIKIYSNAMTVEKALDILGLTIQNDIKKFIKDKEVSPESIRAIEEGGVTLFDTGQLVNSLTYIRVMNP